MVLRCILAIDADGMGVEALTALPKAGIMPAEIWTSSADFPRSVMRARLSGARSRHLVALAKAVKAAGIPVRRFARPWLPALNDALETMPEVDILIVAGSHIIFPKAFLDRLPVPAVNFHPALLPHYRGPFPFHAMLFEGTADEHGGMTLHLISPEIDGGAIIGQRAVRLSDHRHPVPWMNAVTATMEPLLKDDLRAFLEGRIEPRPQEPGSGSSHTAKTFPLHVAPGQTVERIKRFMAVSPNFQLNAHVVLGERWRKRRHVVTGQPDILGPPTGAPPAVTLRHVEFDAADGRVRLRHVSRFERWLGSLRKKTGSRKN